MSFRVSNFIPTHARDVVAIYDEDFNQLFTRARSIRARIREESRIMEHPLESGAVITDHKIIMPVEIEISMILASIDYQDVYKQIRRYYLTSTFLVVQTRSGIYLNQLIAAMPHEEDPDLYDALTLGLSLKEAILVEPQYNIVPANPSNSVTADRGTVQGSTPTMMQTNTITTSVQKTGTI